MYIMLFNTLPLPHTSEKIDSLGPTTAKIDKPLDKQLQIGKETG